LLTRILSKRKSKIIQQREEKRERKLVHAEELRQRKEAAARTERLLEYMKEQQLLKSRADEALQLLWTRHNKRTQAANTIARWWHDILICRSTLSHITKRVKARNICLGASIYANNIKACKPQPPAVDTKPVPLPTSKADSHPFRRRGLALPPKKSK